jgi:HPt (histidine-containing phosphotransfer) domain-containing protein
MSSSDSTPLSPPAENYDHIDWKAFDSLLDITEAWDEPQVMIDLLTQYEIESRKILAAAGRLGSETFLEMRKVLHKLKGSSGSMAFQEVVVRVRIIHDPLTPPPANMIPELLAKIDEAIEESLAAVRSRYPWLKAN